MRLGIFILTILAVVCTHTTQAQYKQLVKDGNKLYQQKKYKEAAAEYQKALQKNPNYTPGAFNLGNALYQQQKYDDTRKLMEQAAKMDTNRIGKSAANYNIGNSYMAEQKWEEAIDAYKKALRANPQDADAKYNLSYAQRKMASDNSQSSKNNKDKIEPSEFAKKLKAKAEQLIAVRKYKDAYQLMQDGLKKDKTVSAFNDFIKRTKDIVEIDN